MTNSVQMLFRYVHQHNNEKNCVNQNNTTHKITQFLLFFEHTTLYVMHVLWVKKIDSDKVEVITFLNSNIVEKENHIDDYYIFMVKVNRNAKKHMNSIVYLNLKSSSRSPIYHIVPAFLYLHHLQPNYRQCHHH